MRPFSAVLNALVVIALVLSACSSQIVIEDTATAGEAGGASLEDVTEADGPDPLRADTEMSETGQGNGSAGGDEPTEPTRPVPSAWVGVPGRDQAGTTSEFHGLIDALADAPALRTTLTATLDNFGSAVPYTEVRESNAGEPGGTYSSGRWGSRILADDLVWSEDRDRPNLYVGVEAREKDEQLTNDHLLARIEDSVVEVVGYEEAADGSARWYLLADPRLLMEPFDDWKATGTIFDMALATATVAPSGELTSIELDTRPATDLRSRDEPWSRPPSAIGVVFETIDSPLPIGQPCDDPMPASDDRSRSVLHCPIDTDGFIAPRVSVGYLDEPAAVSQAFVVANLLARIGYSVELTPLTEGVEAAYAELAANNVDLYATGWFPVDQDQLARSAAGGGTVGDAVVRFSDPLVPDALVSGLVVTTEWAEAANISSIDDIDADPVLYRALDANGNGKGEIEGCPVGRPCRAWLEQQIASSWTNLELTNRSYAEAFDDLFLAKVLGEAALAVATLPDPQFNNVFGDWSVVSVAAGVPEINEEIFGETCAGGPSTCQPGPECRAVSEPCLPVFAQADLEVVANAEWAATNPVGAALIEEMMIHPGWLRAAADDAAVQNSDTREYRVDKFGADRLADDWVSASEDVVLGWTETALALDPDFGIATPVDADEEAAPEPPVSGSAGTPTDPPTRREGDLLAWEQAVLAAVQDSGALERGDSTVLLSTGAGLVCDGAVEVEAMMQLFDAAQGRFSDLGTQMGPFLDLVEACELKPSPGYAASFTSVEAEVLPDGVDEWDEFIAYVQQSGTPWGSVADVEVMAARSCINGNPRLADYANGYAIGDGMLSVSQMQALAAVLDTGCLLGSDRHWRSLVLFDSGRDELRRVFGPDAVESLGDAEFGCMVNAAAALGRPPATVDPVAAMAPVCAPAMVIEADTVRYTSDIVDAATARCVAEGLVGLASATGDPAMYFGRWLSPVFPGQQTMVSQVVRDDCGLSDAQVEDLGIRGV